MNPTAKLYQTVNAAWREGRLENILERKKELASLHAEIKTLKSKLVTAINKDLGVSEPSINEEIRLILEVLKKLYDDLDFPGQLANEKALARGKSLEQNLVPVGPTLIDPCPQFPLSSTLLPLAAAVAAGSAVVILALSQTPATFAIIREMVLATLDREAIAITDGDSSDVRKELGEKRFAVAVLQNHSEKQDLLRRLQKVNTTVRILSPSSGIPAVFVERGVKSLTAVADHILTSILNNPRPSTFRTPRIVLVEESRTNMLATLLTKAHNGAAESVTSSPHAEELQGLLQGKTITSSDLLPAIIQLNSSQIDASEIQKIARHVTTQQRGVVLCPIRSLDHGIDLMNKVNTEDISQAHYVFGDGKVPFYVGAFTNAHQVFVNQIPMRSSMIVCSDSTTSSYDLPYSREDFSINKPYLQVPLRSPLEEDISRSILSHRLALGKIHQPKGGNMSFFEKGLIYGLLTSLVALSGVSYGLVRGFRYLSNI